MKAKDEAKAKSWRKECHTIISQAPPEGLHDYIIRWFETMYGYNPDPQTVPEFGILVWALRRRQFIRSRQVKP